MYPTNLLCSTFVLAKGQLWAKEAYLQPKITRIYRTQGFRGACTVYRMGQREGTGEVDEESGGVVCRTASEICQFVGVRARTLGDVEGEWLGF